MKAATLNPIVKPDLGNRRGVGVWAFLLGLCMGKGNNFFAHFLRAHFVDMGNFIPVFIEQGNIEHYFQFFIGVIADIRRSTLRS